MSDAGHDPIPPLSQEAIEQIVVDHLPKFGRVLADAWEAFAATREQAAPQMIFASASSRGMLVSDFTREPAHRIFGPVADVWVDDRYGRPWVNLAGGSVQVRFRKLTPDLALCRNDSDRALSLAYHLGDPFLPGMEPATVLTAGYVLDLADQGIERLELVCHVGTKDVYYSFPIPLTATASIVSPVSPASTAGTGIGEPGPAQLPLTPLSPPIIRSAQAAAAKRLAVGGQDSHASTTTGEPPAGGSSGPFGGTSA